MAIRSLLFGGIAGLLSFQIAHVLFDLNLLWSLAIYCAIGSKVAMLSTSKSMLNNLRHGVRQGPSYAKPLEPA